MESALMFFLPKVLAVLIAGFLALAEEGPGPSVTPNKLCPLDEITIIEPTGYNLSLLVRMPDIPYLFLADHQAATVVPDYWITHSVSLRAKDLIGFGYSEEGPYVRPVFETPGTYEFYFAENLYTEPENTVSFTRYVEFLGESEDCKSDSPN